MATGREITEGTKDLSKEESWDMQEMIVAWTRVLAVGMRRKEKWSDPGYVLKVEPRGFKTGWM